MKRRISALEITKDLARILRQIASDVDRTFTGIRNAPATLAIPVELDAWRKGRRGTHFDGFEPVHMRSRLSLDEADALAREALRAARSRFES